MFRYQKHISRKLLKKTRKNHINPLLVCAYQRFNFILSRFCGWFWISNQPETEFIFIYKLSNRQVYRERGIQYHNTYNLIVINIFNLRICIMYHRRLFNLISPLNQLNGKKYIENCSIAYFYLTLIMSKKNLLQ